MLFNLKDIIRNIFIISHDLEITKKTPNSLNMNGHIKMKKKNIAALLLKTYISQKNKIMETKYQHNVYVSTRNIISQHGKLQWHATYIFVYNQ
jgi:hypothetical protein